MMHQDALATHAAEAIRQWAAGTDKLIIAIDGYSGVGKTTLLSNLEKLDPDIEAVHRDDFLIARSEVEKLFKAVVDRSEIFEWQVYDNQKLEDVLRAFRSSNAQYETVVYSPASGEVDAPKVYDFSKKALVIDGVFMLHPKVRHLWDKVIYLTGDIEEIDRRRVEREKARWGDEYFPETRPDSYVGQVVRALKRYQKVYKPEEMADLVLSV